MEADMNFPIQSAPAMRGQDRGNLVLPPNASVDTVAQSQGLPGNLCSLCTLLPAPYNTICQAICGGIHIG
jgi:hypothetical protein